PPHRRGGPRWSSGRREDRAGGVHRRCARRFLPLRAAHAEAGPPDPGRGGARPGGGHRLHHPAGRGHAGDMSRGFRIGGHPVHAALSDFPMVLLLLWVALDGTALALGSPLLWMLGRWALIGGVAAAVLAASAGFLDYLGVASGAPRALKTATAHLTVM